MPDNFISGSDAYASVGGSSMNFNRWSVDMEGGIKKFYAFGSAFQRTLEGPNAATITLEGPYNQSNMAIAKNTVYALLLGWETSVEFSVSGRCESISFSTEISESGDPATVRVVFASDGSFTAAAV
jgi:hypothetical protein